MSRYIIDCSDGTVPDGAKSGSDQVDEWLRTILSVDSENTRGKGVITANKINEYRSGKNSPTRSEKAILLIYYKMMEELDWHWENDRPVFKKEDQEWFWNVPQNRLEWLNEQLRCFAAHDERGALYLKLPSDIALYCCLRFDGALAKYDAYHEKVNQILSEKMQMEEKTNAGTEEFLAGVQGSAGLLGQSDVEAVFTYVENVHLYYAGVYEHILNLLLEDSEENCDFSDKEKSFEKYIDKKRMPDMIRYDGRFSREEILMLFALGGKSVEQVNEALQYASYQILKQPDWKTKGMSVTEIEKMSDQEKGAYLEWEWYQAYLREDWNHTWCSLERLGCAVMKGNASRSAKQKHMAAFRRYYFHYGAVYQNKFEFRIWYAALIAELILSKENEELYTEIILSDEYVDKVKYKHKLIDTSAKRKNMVREEEPVIAYYNSRHHEYYSQKAYEQGDDLEVLPTIFRNRMENMTGRETGCYHLFSFLKKYRGETWREEWKQYRAADRERAEQAVLDFHFISILYSCFTGLIFKGALDEDYKEFLYEEKDTKENHPIKETKNQILRMINTVLGGDQESVFPYKLGERYKSAQSYLKRYLHEAQKWDRGKS